MVRVYYSPGYVGAGYSFDTTRKARWIADSLSESPVTGIELTAPDPVTREQVLNPVAPKVNPDRPPPSGSFLDKMILRSKQITP